MAIGERIHFFRNLRGMTQKYLGIRAGFPERSADVRMAQYESGTRTPKCDLIDTFASILEVSPQALMVPEMDSHIGLMHTLFAMEDRYGFSIDRTEEGLCLHITGDGSATRAALLERLASWQEEAEQYRNGEISKEDYDRWRYTYPQMEAERTREALDRRRNAEHD